MPLPGEVKDLSPQPELQGRGAVVVFSPEPQSVLSWNPLELKLMRYRTIVGNAITTLDLCQGY